MDLTDGSDSDGFHFHCNDWQCRYCSEWMVMVDGWWIDDDAHAGCCVAVDGDAKDTAERISELLQLATPTPR